jgi:hypothetical protein
MESFADLDLSRTFTPQDERFLVEPDAARSPRSCAHEQDDPRGRAQLRRLRLRHLPATTRWPSTQGSPKPRCACRS